MSRPQSSDQDSLQISCLESALSELSQPNASDNYSPHVRGSSQRISSSPRAEVGSASISLQKPNCITSTYRYFGEIQDEVPHGYGIRVYTNSGSVEKGEFYLGVFQRLGEFTCTDYGTPLPPLTCFVVDDFAQYTAVHFSGEWLMVLVFGSGCTSPQARIYLASF